MRCRLVFMRLPGRDLATEDVLHHGLPVNVPANRGGQMNYVSTPRFVRPLSLYPGGLGTCRGACARPRRCCWSTSRRSLIEGRFRCQIQCHRPIEARSATVAGSDLVAGCTQQGPERVLPLKAHSSALGWPPTRVEDPPSVVLRAAALASTAVSAGRSPNKARARDFRALTV